jgi:hypothetical protein
MASSCLIGIRQHRFKIALSSSLISTRGSYLKENSNAICLGRTSEFVFLASFQRIPIVLFNKPHL